MRKFISALLLAIALVAGVSSVSWGEEPANIAGAAASEAGSVANDGGTVASDAGSLVSDGGTWEMLDELGGTWE